MKNHRHLVLACLVLGSIAGIAWAQDGERPDALLTSRVAWVEGMLTLPVTIDGESHRFAVDTKAFTSILDARFQGRLKRLDEIPDARSDEYEGQHPGLYAAPESMIVAGTESGAVPFPANQPVVCRNLAYLRQMKQRDVAGILGMEFLMSYALELDLAEGTLRLLDPRRMPPDQHDAALPMSLLSRRPFVRFHSHDLAFWALIDTATHESLIVERDTHEDLVGRRLLRETLFEANVAGHVEVRPGTEGWLKDLTFGPFSHNRVFVSSHAKYANLPYEVNAVGLHYWRRYRCTFDFPGRTVYLSKGPLFELRDDSNHAGIYLGKAVAGEEGRRVIGLALGGEGYWAGVRVGDRLISIDGEAFGDEPYLIVHRRFSWRHGAPRDLVLQRDGEEVRVTLPATKPQPARRIAPPDPGDRASADFDAGDVGPRNRRRAARRLQ